MFRSNIYPKMILLVSFLVLGFSSVFAQTPAMQLKLQLMDDDTWGVYVRPNGVSPSTNTITGSGQVTIVMPDGMLWSNLTSVSGTWANNATVGATPANHPTENPGKTYVSFGLQVDVPQIIYQAGTETLLFTFDRSGPCPDSIYLIENNVDPFDQLPNSYNSNPGNELSVFQAGTSGYSYLGNYALSAWSCHDCDGDGILNGLEDTNGNGTFDVGVDSSALCDPCDPYHPESASIELIGGADVICANDLGDTAYFSVNIEGGWSPFTVRYTDGSSTFTVNNYYSGDSIAFVPTASVTLDLVDIVDSFNCLLDTALTGGLNISVHGPIAVSDHPDNVVECYGNGTFFGIAATNAGDGDIYYNWEVNTGSGWTSLQDGAVYDSTATDTLLLADVAGKHGWQYRCAIFTDVCDTVWSNPALLQVEGPITITTHPTNFINCDSESASFSAVAANAGAVGTMAYQWQYSTDGTNFFDLPPGAGPGTAFYVNPTTVNLTINNIDIQQDGWYFRMKVSTGQCDTVFTNAAILDIEGPLTITDHPDDISNCAGGEVNFYSTFTNPGTGQTNTIWQINTGSGWVNLTNASGVYASIAGTHIGAGATDTLTITDVEGLDGFQYRMCITTPTCSVPVYSNPATLSVSGNVTFSNHPDDITVCSANDTIFVATASIPQGTFTYGWQYSNDNGTTWQTLNMSGVFSHTTTGAITSGSDTLQISDVAGLYDYRFRAVAFATDCDSVVSNEARLAVEGPLSVAAHPTSVTECSGDAVLFQATINNPGVAGSTIYRWQVSPTGSGGPWINLSNNTTYGGTGTNTLTISNIAGMHGYCFRLSARTSTCNIIFTNPACLTVEGPITIANADQPDDVTLCSDDVATFTSVADPGTSGSLTYQWQVSSDNGTNWSDITGLTDGGVYSNFTSTTLTVNNVAGLYNRCYRMEFSLTTCNPVYSNKACLNIEGPITISDQPDDVTECSGDPVLFTVGITNASLDFTNNSGIYYQWQESTNGTTWTSVVDGLDFGGVNTDSLLLNNTDGRDDNQYRVLIWSEHCDTLVSDAATLSIEGPVSFIDDPDNWTECSGSGHTFQATTANPGLGSILYQWEISADSGATWTNVPNGTVNGFSGVTTTTLNINDVVNLYGERFRLKAWTAYCDTLWSNYAVLTVEGPIAFTDQPDSDTICSGSSATFEVETENTGQGAITYQWQVSPSGCTGPWFNLSNNSIYGGVKTAHLSVSNVAGFNGYGYRVLIQTSTCASIASDPACLTVEGPITFSDHPEDITQCSAEGVTFTAAAGITPGNAGTITYQWQGSSDGGLNWSNLVNGPVYSGVTTGTLTIPNVAGLDNWRYRLRATTGVCTTPVSSNVAILDVEGPLNITQQPISLTNCSDKEALFTASMSNPGDGQIQYQWEQSTNGGTTWAPIYDGTVGLNVFAGTSSDTLLISPIIGLNGTRYRLKGWTGTCDTLTTAEVILNVEGPITFTDQPDDVTLCAGDATCFTIAIDNSTGVGTVQYQWQVSTVSGVWTNLSNTAPYSGAFTNQLCISDISNLYNRKYRCGVRTGNCDWSYSDLANLFVTGPITISQQPVDAAVCSNIGHIFTTTVTNPGSGALVFQWQVSSNGGTNWANINNGSNGVNTGTYQGTKTEDLNISLVENMDGFMFRLLINIGTTCYDTTNAVTLTVLDACGTGICDFDLDGSDNDTDPDDDNDQLADYWEDWMTTHNVTDGWNYLDNLGVLINYSRCDIDSDNDGLLDNQEDPDGDAINNGEETDTDGIFDGNPLDPCDPVLGPTCVGINLAIRVNLQGAFIGVSNSDTLMRATLRDYGVNDEVLIPRQEPYENMQTFAHVGPDGGGTEVISPADSAVIFAISNKDAIVDWVFVELRSSTALDSVATTRAALLQRDGNVIDINGDSILHFPTANAGAFYVAVRHRNHLGVMTGEAIELSPIVTELDFTDPSFPTTGAYAQMNRNGQMAMWAGDLNSDGRTVYQGPGNDILKLFTTVLYDPDNTTFIANFISEGYQTADVDLNGRAIYQGPNNDRSMLLLNTILSHPANVNLIANYVILETLP